MKWTGWLLFVALSGVGALAPAQDWGGRWGRGESNEPISAEEAAERLRRAEFFLHEMDQNRNGVLEAEEAEGRRRYFAERILQRAGLATEFPVAISKVNEGLRNYYTDAQQAAPGGSPSGPYPGGPPGGGPPPGAPPSSSTESGSGTAKTPAVPLVPGFGVPSNLPPPPGFGMELAQVPAVAGDSSNGSRESGSSGGTSGGGTSGAASSGSSSSPSASSSSSGGDELAERYRRYARELIKKYDKNGNGQLERDEWKAMSGNPENADRNHDGVITVDELTARLIEMGRSGSSGGGSSRSGPPGSGGSRERSTSAAGAAKPALRFRTAAERLPEGLPDWFAPKDADGDGQVAMAEYATTWSDRTVAEFARYDLDHDGFITPSECLAALKQPEEATSSGESGSKPPASSSQHENENASSEGSGGASGDRKPGDEPSTGRLEERRGENGEGRERRGFWGRR